MLTTYKEVVTCVGIKSSAYTASATGKVFDQHGGGRVLVARVVVDDHAHFGHLQRGVGLAERVLGHDGSKGVVESREELVVQHVVILKREQLELAQVDAFHGRIVVGGRVSVLIALVVLRVARQGFDKGVGETGINHLMSVRRHGWNLAIVASTTMGAFALAFGGGSPRRVRLSSGPGIAFGLLGGRVGFHGRRCRRSGRRSCGRSGAMGVRRGTLAGNVTLGGGSRLDGDLVVQTIRHEVRHLR